MKVLVIGKPVYDYILPLVEFPLDGDKFFIEKSINTLSNFTSIVSILLSNYGLDTSYTGVIGEDNVGEKIKEIFTNNNVDIEYIETSYQEKSCISHKIYNQKTNTFTSIEESPIKQGLIKYKYEFTPDVVIMDNSDYNANMAAINNYENAKLIYIGEKYTKESSVYCNKCNYVISNLKFASELTGVLNNLNKPKTIVSLFQKYIDLYNSKLIIKLDNFDMLYCINDEVRLIKNVNNNLKNKDYLYYSILIYFLINTDNIENSIKYTNKVMLNTNNDIDILKNIPENKAIENYVTEIKNIENTTEPLVNANENNEKTITQTVQNTNTTNNVANNTTPSKQKQDILTPSQNNVVPKQTTQPEKIVQAEVTKIDNLEMPQNKGDNNIERL